MEERKEIFTDGIGSIHFYKGTVRLDLVSVEPKGKGEKEKVVFKERIIMPPEGLLSSFNAMQKLINQLVEANVLKKVEPKPAENK